RTPLLITIAPGPDVVIVPPRIVPLLVSVTVLLICPVVPRARVEPEMPNRSFSTRLLIVCVLPPESVINRSPGGLMVTSSPAPGSAGLRLQLVGVSQSPSASGTHETAPPRATEAARQKIAIITVFFTSAFMRTPPGEAAPHRAKKCHKIPIQSAHAKAHPNGDVTEAIAPGREFYALIERNIPQCPHQGMSWP